MAQFFEGIVCARLPHCTWRWDCWPILCKIEAIPDVHHRTSALPLQDMKKCVFVVHAACLSALPELAQQCCMLLLFREGSAFRLVCRRLISCHRTSLDCFDDTSCLNLP